MVYPSGFLVFKNPMPTAPDPPAWCSMTMGCCMIPLVALAKGRRVISMLPPGGQHITKKIGFSGYFAHDGRLIKNKGVKSSRAVPTVFRDLLWFTFLALLQNDFPF